MGGHLATARANIQIQKRYQIALSTKYISFVYVLFVYYIVIFLLKQNEKKKKKKQTNGTDSMLFHNATEKKDLVYRERFS